MPSIIGYGGYRLGGWTGAEGWIQPEMLLKWYDDGRQASVRFFTEDRAPAMGQLSHDTGAL
jgi:hypothetical protein